MQVLVLDPEPRNVFELAFKGTHRVGRPGPAGRIVMGNGPEMVFSAPPDAHGHPDVLTPEDAFVGSINSCIMLMFIWAAKRFKVNLTGYECYAEGVKLASKGSPLLEDLTTLAEKGVELIVCTTCLEYLDLLDDLAVGKAGSMKDIIAAQATAARVITL